MNEWKEYKIGDILQLEYGKSLKNYHDGVGKYDVFGTNGKIGKTDKYLFDKPSLVIGRKGAYREVHLANSPFFVIDTAFYTKNKFEWLDTIFLYYWFKNIDINLMDSGSAIPSTSRDEVYDLDILLPALSEQTAIASILSSLDDKIDLLQRQNATLEKMAETLFRQWFVEEAKEEWEEGKLRDLVESANTGLDAIMRAPIIENFTGIKCLRIQDISQSKPISKWGNTSVSESDFVKAQLKKGDIIMARTCSPGILVHIQEDLPAVFNNGLARIRANKSNCHPLFLKYLFKTDLFINHIYGISDGTAVQLNMKLGDLLSYDLWIPPKGYLDSYIEIVQKWDDKILNNQAQIRTLTTLRDTLLPKLMSGEVRVIP